MEAVNYQCPAGTFKITNTVCDLKNKLNTCKQYNGDYDQCLCIAYNAPATTFVDGTLYVIEDTTTSLLCGPDNGIPGSNVLGITANLVVQVTNESSVADSVSDWCSSSSHSSDSSSDSDCSSSSCSSDSSCSSKKKCRPMRCPRPPKCCPPRCKCK